MTLEPAPSQFYSMDQLSAAVLERVLELAQRGKRDRWSQHSQALAGKVIGLLFLNKSLRTRASFTSGILRLGGHPMVLNVSSESYILEHRFGVPMDGTAQEHAKEAVRVVSRYVDLLGVRTFAHLDESESWEELRQDTLWHLFAEYATVPLINMESAIWHPCQSLADALTLREHLGEQLQGKKFVLSWAPHPRPLCTATPNSVLAMACQLGMDVTLACPAGYELDKVVIEVSQKCAQAAGGSLVINNSQEKAFAGADVVYAKNWFPPQYIGQADKLTYSSKPSDWTVAARQMQHTNEAFFMHCLPVRRNVVVADEVLDSKKSLIIDQAENRMHAQNALLLEMLQS